MPAPLVYGLVSVAGKLVVQALKNVPKNANIVSKHRLRSTAEKALARLERSKDVGPKRAPGVTAGGGTQRSAVIGKERVKKYTRNRRLEGALGLAGIQGGVVGTAVLIDAINKARKKKLGHAETEKLKDKYLRAVTQNIMTDKNRRPTAVEKQKASNKFDAYISKKTKNLTLKGKT